MLRRVVLAALVAVFTGGAFAAGPFDGIYNLPNTKEYLSVHQNGNSLIVGYFATIPASGVTFLLGDGQRFPPARVDYWDLLNGTISGNSARLVGEIAYGSCSSTIDVAFSSSAVSVTQRFIDTTSLGFEQGIDCPAYQRFLVQQRGLTQTWTRVF